MGPKALYGCSQKGSYIRPLIGVQQAKEKLALLDRAISDLPRCPICGQSIEKDCPIALGECIGNCRCHAPGLLPRFRTGRFQVDRIAGVLGNALDLLFGIGHW